MAVEYRNKMNLDLNSTKCFLCGLSFDLDPSFTSEDSYETIPLIHLISMPKQKEFLENISETIP